MKSLVTLPGMHTDHTLLNVVRSRGPGRIRDAVVIDNLETKPDSIISKGIVGQVGSIITTKILGAENNLKTHILLSQMHLQVLRSAFFINNFEPKPDSILSKGKVKQVGFIITRINIFIEKTPYDKHIVGRR